MWGEDTASVGDGFEGFRYWVCGGPILFSISATKTIFKNASANTRDTVLIDTDTDTDTASLLTWHVTYPEHETKLPAEARCLSLINTLQYLISLCEPSVTLFS